MKKMIASMVILFVSSAAFAIVDAHSKVYLVVQDIQTEEFFVERAPIIGCYGLARGPQLVQFTTEYKVNSNMGCGDQVLQENINYLVCAKVVSAKETDDLSSYSEITLDISNCAAKDDTKFISVLNTAAKLNFPIKKGAIKLNLIK